MNFRKLRIILCASAVFCLMACGDDSSSSTTGSESELQKEYAEVQKEMAEGFEKLGKCTEDNAGDEKSVTVQGKNYKVVCEDGEWESDELEELVKEYEKNLAENGKMLTVGKGCDFELLDPVWSYELISNLYGTGSRYIASMKIDGTTLIRSSVDSTYSSGCKYKSIPAGRNSEKIDEYTTREFSEECTDDDLSIVIEKITTENAVDDVHTREFYFEEFMNECKSANETAGDEPVSGSISGKGDGGKDEEGKGEGKNVNSGDDPVMTDVNCEGMIYKNDTWRIFSIDSLKAIIVITYEWDGLSFFQRRVSTMNMESQEECEAQMKRMSSTTGVSCEYGRLSQEKISGPFEKKSEEEKMEFFDEIRVSQCFGKV